MSKSKIHKAGKNHGPCINCGIDIERGQIYRQKLREETPEDRKERKEVIIKTDSKKRLVIVKMHEVCYLGR